MKPCTGVVSCSSSATRPGLLNTLILLMLSHASVLSANGCENPMWKEEGDIIVIKAENGDYERDPKWAFKKYDGDTFLGYDMGNSSRSTYEISEVKAICYPVTFSRKGFYKFEMKTWVQSGWNSDHITNFNDVWVKLNGRPWLLTKASQSVKNSRNRYGKKYLWAHSSSVTNQWTWSTYGARRDRDEKSSDPYEIYTKINEKSTVTEVCIKPRSNKFRLSKLVFYHVNRATEKQAHNHAETITCNDPISCDLSRAAMYKCKGRIAMSFDGNYVDTQDWGAGPMALAIIDKLGLREKVVHVDWNNRLGLSEGDYAWNMNVSMIKAARKFGFKRAAFFDDENQLDASIQNLRMEIDKSSADDPLYILSGGPLELIYRALKASKSSVRQHIYVISHSRFNFWHTHRPEMTHARKDIEDLGAKFVPIREQHDDLNRGLTHGDFLYLHYSPKSKYNFVYDRIQKSNAWSVADAGMAYWLLTGDNKANASTLRDFLTLNDEVTSLPTPEYQLHWHDEFSVEGKPDPSKWGYEIGYVRNNELQNYTDQNAFCDNGKLVIEGRRTFDGAGVAHYTSSSIITLGKFHYLYGRFIIRAKISTKNGLWPAAWFMGETGRWPHRGEIDLLEYFTGKLKANVIWGGYDRGESIWDRSSKWIGLKDPYWNDKFHIWRMDWDLNWIRLYLDDELLNEARVADARNLNTEWGPELPFRQPIWILINLAIGGTVGGDPTYTPFPSRYLVDYVRVYQKKR